MIAVVGLLLRLELSLLCRGTYPAAQDERQDLRDQESPMGMVINRVEIELPLRMHVQGDPSPCAKPPVDFKSKVQF